MPFTASNIAAPTSPVCLLVTNGEVAGVDGVVTAGVNTAVCVTEIQSRIGSLAPAVAGAATAAATTKARIRVTIGPPVCVLCGGPACQPAKGQAGRRTRMSRSRGAVSGRRNPTDFPAGVNRVLKEKEKGKVTA